MSRNNHNVQLFMTQWGYVAPKIGYEAARRAAELALKLDPSLAEPHQILAFVAIQYDWDWSAAASENERESELDPRYPMGRASRGVLSLALGRLDDATSQMNAALRLDPLNPNIHFLRGWALFWSDHLPEAEASFRRVLQISPVSRGMGKRNRQRSCNPERARRGLRVVGPRVCAER
jgi:tetratricopeptide (TPR) repeat protein